LTDPQPQLEPDDLQQLRDASEKCARLTGQIGNVIIGQDQTVRALLAAVLAEGHTLIVGVPGLAKTLLVHTLAEALGGKFSRVQFTPDLMPADIVGMELLQEDEQTGRRAMQFVPGPIFTNLLLADEINRTPPKTQAALLEAMQERGVTSMGQRHELEPPFMVVATQNPIEQEGTYPLPEAQLDRFMFSLPMDYPPVDEEEDIVLATTAPRSGRVEAVFDRATLIATQQLVRRVPVSRHVVRYAVALARATRPAGADATDATGDVDADAQGPRQFIQWGAGPRAGQMMILGGKALAVMDGEPTVTTDHVRAIAPLVLRHRVLPNYHAAAEGHTADTLVERIIAGVEPE